MMNDAPYRRPTMEELMDDDTAHVDALPSRPGTVIDMAKLGRGIRSARIYEGYARAEDFAAAIERATGLPVSKGMVYDIENGEKNITFEEVVAIAKTLRQRGGLHYFFDALPPETADLLRELEGRS
jgi:nucleoside-diphosphate-sugar epimerase